MVAFAGDSLISLIATTMLKDYTNKNLSGEYH